MRNTRSLVIAILMHAGSFNYVRVERVTNMFYYWNILFFQALLFTCVGEKTCRLVEISKKNITLKLVRLAVLLIFTYFK